MRRTPFAIFGLALLAISFLFLPGSFPTGAVIGMDVLPASTRAASILSFIALVVLFFAREDQSLEGRIKAHWRKYSVKHRSILQDIEQNYLAEQETLEPVTEMQLRVEQAVTGRGRILDSVFLNRMPNYEGQFPQGHAAMGGRVIEVESHICKSGRHQGKLIHFGQPANARYIWVVDEEANFIVANRQTMLHEMPQLAGKMKNPFHRLHKLPHPTLASGRKVYGSGEVLVEGGLVRSFNTASGHYLDIKNISRFNEQGQQVFLHFAEVVGWKQVAGGARYERKY